MFHKIRRILLILLSVLLVLSILLSVIGAMTVRRSFPKINGENHLTGLNAPVDVYRDTLGVPHIYASTTHDLFFTQGFTHAQDRFWQMDFWRHIGSGRLSEMLGEGQLDTDKFLRTLGWARVAQREIEGMDPNTLLILKAYAEGVNAYLAGHQGSALSLEYAVLKLLNADYKPEPWTPIHTLTWAKVMAWDLGGNMGEEIERAILLKTFSAEQITELYPPYPVDHPVIVSSSELLFRQVKPSYTPALFTSLFQQSNLLDLPLTTSQAHIAALNALLGPISSGIGSNNWVISGKLTSTGKPLLANDPHLASQMPSIWYENGLHCTPQSTECPYEVVGFSFPGAPGVIIGHNNRLAWGLTNLGPDTQDLYIEKINPDNPNQYEVNGVWTDMQSVQETLLVGGGKPVELIVRYTRHGPIISDTYSDLADFAGQSGLNLPARYVIALHWTALEPTYLFRAIDAFNRAQNWDEFHEGARYFSIAAQNIVYADVDGNIAYQSTGNIPIRANGSGILPVPGWTDEYEWSRNSNSDYIPFEKMPVALNPPQGYLVTANNAVVNKDYPYFISADWDYGYRAQRIVDLITNSPGSIDIPYIQMIQGDNKNLNAEKLIPVLMNISLDDARLEKTRFLFQLWDYQQFMDSAPAALFAAFWKHLLADTFHDDLPQDFWPDGESRWFEVIANLVDQPDNTWWDNRTTPALETRDMIFHQAFDEAVTELEKTLGKDPNRWKWGDLHTITFRNQTLGDESSPGPIQALFNRGPFRTSGGSGIVNATGWTPANSYEVDWLPSLRMIVDLNSLSSSLAIHTTGQSGHAYHPHYIDMADLWRTIQYRPMLWERDQIEKASEGHLKLIP